MPTHAFSEDKDAPVEVAAAVVLPGALDAAEVAVVVEGDDDEG